MKLFNWKLFIISVLFSGTALAQDGIVSITKSAEIDRVLSVKKALNKEKQFIKIQIYSGNRSGAESALESFKADFPKYTIEMKYETPNYKIWVGKFRTQLEADRELQLVKKSFPNAFSLKS